jgi:hypothetical protein
LAILFSLFVVVNVSAAYLDGRENQKTPLHRNILNNGGFELGSDTNWTKTGSGVYYGSWGITFGILTSGIGDTSVKYESASAAGETLCHDAVDVPNYLSQQNGEVRLKCVTEDTLTATHIVTVKDGSGNLLNTSSKTINCGNDDTMEETRDNFVFPAYTGSATVQVCIETVGTSEPDIGLDDFYLGPATNLTSATVISEWESYTPTTNGLGTPTINSAEWRRVGDSMEVRANITVGTPTAAEFQVGLPNSLTVATGLSLEMVGTLQRDASVETHYTVLATAGDAFFNIGYRYASGNAAFAAANGNDLMNSSQTFAIIASVPIAEWSGTVSAFKADQTNRPWTAYTPTFTGFGTATNVECYHKRQGEDMLIRCGFTSGTPTAVEARVSLPGSYTSKSLIDTIEKAGLFVRNATTVTNTAPVLIEPSAAYVTFGGHVGQSANTMTKNTGSGLTGSSNGSHFTARVPIEGWNETMNAPYIKNSVVTSSDSVTATEMAQLNCSSSSSILSEHGSWLASVGNVSTGACTVTIDSGIFSSSPYCWAQIGDSGFASTAAGLNVIASSSTSVSVDCYAGGDCTDYDVQFFCMGPR